MVRFSWFSLVVVMVMILAMIGLAMSFMGCGSEDLLSGYNPDAGIGAIATPQGDGKYIVAINDGFPYDRLPDTETLAKLNEGEIVLAPASLPDIWYKTNAIIKTGKIGFEEGTGLSVNGKISLTLIPNRFVVEAGQVGYDFYWIISRKASSSGEFYYWLKWSDGTMPQYADSAGKTYFKIADNGTVTWVNQGSQILNHTIVLENSVLNTVGDVYVKGDKSTLGQWLKMDTISPNGRQLTVYAGTGRETLEFKDSSGHKFRYVVKVDGVIITYGSPDRDYMPTFDYATNGVINIGNNYNYLVELAVADSGGVIPPVVPQDGDAMRIEGTNFMIKLAYLKDMNGAVATANDNFYLMGSMPGTGWTWAERSEKFRGQISGVWVVFSLLDFPQGNSVCNVCWGTDHWLLWTQEALRDNYLWVTTDQGGKAIGVKRNSNTFSKI